MKISADKVVFLAILLIAGVLLAPAASAQRARTPAPPARPPVAAPPVLTQPRLNAPSMRVPQVTLPRQEPLVLPPPPVIAPGVGDGGGDALCSDEDALAGYCVEVSRLPRCPGDPRCPDPASLNSSP